MIFDIENCYTRDQLIDSIQDTCATLAISHDAPSLEMIEEWFDRYDYIKERECQLS